MRGNLGRGEEACVREGLFRGFGVVVKERLPRVGRGQVRMLLMDAVKSVDAI